MDVERIAIRLFILEIFHKSIQIKNFIPTKFTNTFYIMDIDGNPQENVPESSEYKTILYDHNTIDSKIRELGKRISEDYKD